MKQPVLTTERLLLRPFVAADAAAVERLAGASEVANTTLTIPHPYPAGAAIGWIETHAPAWESQKRLTLALCLIEAPDDIIGAIGLALSREHAHGELGYWVGSEWWGRGYATEAARAVMEHGFTTLGLHRVQAQHFVRNEASGRVMQKLGMKFEGTHREIFRRMGRFEDVAVYAALAREWNTEP